MPPPIRQPVMAEILLVQDDHADTLVTLEALADNKLLNRLVIVTDGEQALRYLRRQGAHAAAQRPDLVLLDLNLPRLDGYELLRFIRHDPRLMGLPVAVLGRPDLEGELLQRQGLTADAYLDRPVRFDHIMQLVRQVQYLQFMFVKFDGPGIHS